jgi:BNR repeat-like domain
MLHKLTKGTTMQTNLHQASLLPKRQRCAPRARLAAQLAVCAMAASSGGAFADAFDFDFRFLASAPTKFADNCNGVPQTGNLFKNSEVEPYLAINPRNPLNLVGVWQQDRWSNGGSQGLGTGVSFDGGVTWKQIYLPFSRCAGGNAANGGDYNRASDPWVSFSPNGVVHQMALSVSGTAFEADGISAMLVSRSTDGGLTWSPSTTLIRDAGAQFFNDKNSITADPTDSRYVYAVWDRLVDVGGGPTLLARSVDNGKTWQPTKPIYDPGPDTQTIGNQIVVLPSGVVINLFTQIDQITGAAFFGIIRSTDKGQTWSQPFKIADDRSIGASDPENGTAIRDGAGIGSIAVGKKGELYATWADSRFSNGARDGIAFSRSLDGGITWSAPTQINRVPGVQAFTPIVHVRRDGTIGITHYDLRSNTADPATLPTDYWLLRSKDGGNTWRESRVTGTFDLSTAPIARGLFLGDYQGLSSIGPIFVPFFVQTTGDLNNRNDVFSKLAINVGKGTKGGEDSLKRAAEEEDNLPAVAGAEAEGAMDMGAEMQKKLKDKTTKLMQRRVDRWDEVMQRQGRR